MPTDIRIPSASTVNNYGNALDRLTLKHGSEFINDAVELRLGLDGSTTRNKTILAAGLTNQKKEFFGLGFVEIPSKDAESTFQGYLRILKRFDFEGTVLILRLFQKVMKYDSYRM